MAPPGRRRLELSPAAILLGLVFLFSSTASAASAVLGVDLGTEYIKAALVKPGIPLEIVLTKDSKRKELSAVAFKPSKGGVLAAGSYPERFYGSDAAALTARFPGDVYPNLKSLLGVSSDSDVTKLYTERYPALDVTATEGRKTVSLNSGIFAEGEKSFSVEELLAMELKNVRENAKALAGKGVDIQDVVFTVPPFYTVAERRALDVAARLAGMKVLSVVSDGLAVGINYATSRTFPVVTDGGKPEINLVFDMGAGSTSATVLKFQGKQVKDVGRFNKTVQEVQVLGTGWDRTLGGDSLNAIVLDDMVSTFTAQPAAKSASLTAAKVKGHGRTAAKLWKEAEKVRQVLSANTQTSAFFEGLHEEVDLRYKLTRSKYEELTADIATRVDGPINQALEAAGIKLSEIDSIIVHGGATRTPFVQSRLESLVGKAKIRANVNSDEAAVFGAAFKAAGLSPSFRVKEIRDVDLQGYAHGIQYQFNLKNRDQKIFTPNSKLGATKDLPFQMMGEFEFTVYQALPGAGSDVVKEPILYFKSGNLTRAVTKMIDTDGCDRESFNNYVQVRLSPITGVPEISSAWVTCEGEEEAKGGGIVDGVKNLFGMGGKKDQEPLKESESASESASTSKSAKGSKASKSSKSAKSSASTSESAEASEAAKPKKTQFKSAITYDVTQQGYEKHPRKEFKRMQDRLAAFDTSDRARRAREETLNTLEAFTYRARDYLEDESFISAATKATWTSLSEKLSAASEWIYESGSDATEDVLKSKLKELKDIVDPILKRKDETTNRPDAIKQFQESIDGLKSVVPMMKENIENAAAASSSKSAEDASKSSAASTSSSDAASSSADPLADLEEGESASESVAEPAPTEAPVASIYSDEDVKFVEDALKTAEKWLEDSQTKQKKLKATDDPAFTVKDLKDQSKKLNDAVENMMIKKFRYVQQEQQQQQQQQKPKPKSKPKKKAANKKSSKKDKADSKDSPADSDSATTAETKKKRPSDAELAAALKKAGIKDDRIKLKASDSLPDEVAGEDGRPLTKLDLAEDASEADILAAIERAMGTGGKEKDGNGEGGHDEL
ncbi:heat shock protein 70-like protein-like protein [Massariosphaeria phaeospora]|uniref:Heat shock protein 70-like protein-like protein n=1 Tax=Massariosphaeria phaeospora TaxID=100035 RepID=A0A7C8I9U7_9PLEO|nr:heat shock protein 70-like protein-like protein [Massariosphaeria phaeospora]